MSQPPSISHIKWVMDGGRVLPIHSEFFFLSINHGMYFKTTCVGAKSAGSFLCKPQMTQPVFLFSSGKPTKCLSSQPVCMFPFPFVHKLQPLFLHLFVNNQQNVFQDDLCIGAPLTNSLSSAIFLPWWPSYRGCLWHFPQSSMCSCACFFSLIS